MTDVPPELQPETPEESSRRQRTMWLGIGVPSLIGAIIAVALGIPWWIVAIFIAVEALGIFFST